MNALVVSSEPLLTSKSASDASSYQTDERTDKHVTQTQDFLSPKTGKSSSPPKRSSSTTRPAFQTRPDPRRANGTGDDPFALRDLDEDSNDNSSSDDPHDDMQRRRKKKNYGKATRLEGEPPEFYNGDRAKMLSFLMEFKAFISMNSGATIARDPFERCTYFLSRIRGPDVKDWKLRQTNWLDAAQRDPGRLLPFGMNAWKALEQEFRKAFQDYAERERACDDLENLKMKDGHIDEYIATFEQLVHRAGSNPDDPLVLGLFARGLPKLLAVNCIKIEQTENFAQWAIAARRQHRNYLRRQAIFAD